MDGTFEEKVEGVLKFINLVTTKELAEFIVHQCESIDGLTKNNKSFVMAFRKDNTNKD